MSGTTVVLYHRGPNGAEILRCQPLERADRLLTVAETGDSLHRVGNEVANQPPELFAEIRRQRTSGEFVPV